MLFVIASSSLGIKSHMGTIVQLLCSLLYMYQTSKHEKRLYGVSLRYGLISHIFVQYHFTSEYLKRCGLLSAHP